MANSNFGILTYFNSYFEPNVKGLKLIGAKNYKMKLTQQIYYYYLL